MLTRKAVFLALILLTVVVPSAHAQDTTPTSLSITVYSDGTAKAVYLLDAEPTQVRVDVELFGLPFSNLVIRDEEGNPLAYTVHDSNVTIDSIGALELDIQYITSSLTAKYGTLWELNITAPTETRIILPLGASIVDLVTFPTNIGVVDGKSYLDFTIGDISLYYIIGLPSIAIEANEAINTADDYITTKTIEGFKLTTASNLLTQAEAQYNQGEYLEATSLAETAYIQAQTLVTQAESSLIALQRAEDAITEAQEDGRTVNLALAESMYDTAAEFYDAGDYAEAVTTANQAYQLALQAETTSSGGGNTMLYIVVLAALLAVGGGYMYMQKKKDSSESHSSQVMKQIEVDLDKILSEHDLRLEEREVLRYIAEHKGEVFASEIRDRFEMPRSTTWRLIQRLKDLEIIEEVKIGNQSLLRITPTYQRRK